VILEAKIFIFLGLKMTAEEQISHLQGQLTAALSRNAELEVRISELEALLLKLMTVKTSKNSHNPPSSDKFRNRKSLREKSDKPVGGQPGHKGKTLKMVESPDVTEKIYPNYCQQCGSSLLGAAFELSARRQVIDIPPIVPVITEYQSYATRCSCGHRQCGMFPAGPEAAIFLKNNRTLARGFASCQKS